MTNVLVGRGGDTDTGQRPGKMEAEVGGMQGGAHKSRDEDGFQKQEPGKEIGSPLCFREERSLTVI